MKKGYFFTLDAFMAISILVICVLLIFSVHSSEPQPVQSIYISDDVMFFLSSTRVYELQNPFVRSLVLAGNITSDQNSLLEQAVIFAINDKKPQADAFLRNVTESLVPKKYGLMVRFYNNTEIYSNTLSQGTTAQNMSTLLVNSKRIMFGLDGEKAWGPLIAEVRLWQ